MRILRILPHFISFHPAHSGGRLSCDLNVKAKFVPSHHGDDVLVAGATGVQVYFGRIFHWKHQRRRREERSHCFEGRHQYGVALKTQTCLYFEYYNIIILKNHCKTTFPEP